MNSGQFIFFNKKGFEGVVHLKIQGLDSFITDLNIDGYRARYQSEITQDNIELISRHESKLKLLSKIVSTNGFLLGVNKLISPHIMIYTIGVDFTTNIRLFASVTPLDYPDRILTIKIC